MQRGDDVDDSTSAPQADEVKRALMGTRFKLQQEHWQAQRDELRGAMVYFWGAYEVPFAAEWREGDAVVRAAMVRTAVEALPPLKQFGGLFPLLCPEIVDYGKSMLAMRKDASSTALRDWEENILLMMKRLIDESENEEEFYDTSALKGMLADEIPQAATARSIGLNGLLLLRSCLLLCFCQAIAVAFRASRKLVVTTLDGKV